LRVVKYLFIFVGVINAIDMILKREKYQEFHENGKLNIEGEIAVIAPMWKHLYDYRDGFECHKDHPVCRIGLWTCYYSNGQLSWQLRFDDYGFYTGEKFPKYQKDGTLIDN